MKKSFLLFALAAMSVVTNAQSWSRSTTSPYFWSSTVTTDKVAIGFATTPAAMLHVKSSAEILRLETTSTTGNNYLQFNNPNASLGYIGFYGTSNNNLNIVNTANSPIIFSTSSNGSAIEKVRIDASGNVGIGTNLPQKSLHVKSSAEILRLETTGSTGQNYISFNTSSAVMGTLGYMNTSDNSLFIANNLSAPILFYTNNTERMRIDANGNVGIGINNPTSPLQLNSTLATNGGIGFYASITGAGSGELGVGIMVMASRIILNSGYTGTSGTAAVYYSNLSTSSGSNPYSGTGRANYGIQTDSRGTNSGTNVGGDFLALYGKKNYGLMGHATYNYNSPTSNIGVIGFAAGATNNVGGYFGSFPLNNGGTEPVFESASLIADNGTTSDPIFLARNNGTKVFIINSVGNVLIGKTTQTNSTYKLEVEGKIRAAEVVINSTGADFVFENNYKPRSLSDLEQYINANKHLPEIPSAKEMQANGVSVNDLQTKLLQKVEELTLYMIELKKENDLLKVEVNKLKSR